MTCFLFASSFIFIRTFRAQAWWRRRLSGHRRWRWLSCCWSWWQWQRRWWWLSRCWSWWQRQRRLSCRFLLFIGSTCDSQKFSHNIFLFFFAIRMRPVCLTERCPESSRIPASSSSGNRAWEARRIRASSSSSNQAWEARRIGRPTIYLTVFLLTRHLVHPELEDSLRTADMLPPRRLDLQLSRQ